jgi:hypothetical protein
MVVDDTQYFSLADIGVVPDSDGNITWYEGDDDGGKPARAAAPAIVDCGSGIPAATGGTKGTGANAVALLAARAAYIDAQKKLLANANFLCTACPVPGACGRFTMTITTGWVTPIPAKAAGGGFTATATYTGAYMGACTDCPQ